MFNYFLYFKYENSEQKYSKYIYYLILCFIVSVFFKSSPAISNGAILAIVILSLFSFNKNNITNRIYLYLGFIAFFLLETLSLIYTNNFNEGLSFLSLRFPFLLFALAFSFIQLSKKHLMKILLFYCLITTFVSVISFFYGVYLTFKFSDSGYLYNDNISEYIIGKQAVYFSYYVNVAVFGLFYLLKQFKFKLDKKLLIIGAIFWLFFINFMLACKMAMFSLYLLSGIQFMEYVLIQKKYKELFLVLFGTLIFIFLIVKISPKTFNRFTGIFQIEYQFDNTKNENHFNAEFDKTKWNGTNTRAAIWNCAQEIFKENPILGVGIGDKQTELMEKFKQHHFTYAIKTNKNTHNQFLDIVISLGLVGLIIFLITYFIIPIWYLFKSKSYFSIYVFICLLFSLLTENMFDRYQGVILISFMLPFVIKLEEKTL